MDSVQGIKICFENFYLIQEYLLFDKYLLKWKYVKITDFFKFKKINNFYIKYNNVTF